MGGTKPQRRTDPPAPPPPADGARIALLPVDAHDGENATGDALRTRLTRARVRTSAVYGAAGAAYAAAMATAAAVESNTLSFWPWLILAVSFAWPAVLIALLFGVLRLRIKLLLVVVYSVVFVVGFQMVEDATFAVFFANTFATLAALTIRARRIRAVAPLVASFVSIQMTGFAAVLALFGVVGGEVDAEGVPIDMFNNIGLTLLAFLAVLAASPVIGWYALRLVGRAYERKRVSDQSMTMASVWILFVGAHAIAFADSPPWLVVPLAALVLYLVLSLAGFRVVRRRRESEDRPRLLVLRVFALGRRSRRLFDGLADRWRYVGSLQLIAGPDLASSTVEPHEFFDFLRRRLDSRFIGTDEDVAARFRELDTEPDLDGRFRITDFFCHDRVWRTVLRQLARDSHVVLMDLRGFSSVNAGCAYELGELVAAVPLDRIVLVTDTRTDDGFLSQVLSSAWDQLPPTSPNYLSPRPALRVFRETGWFGVDHERLFAVVCDGVRAGREDAEARAPA
jgi:hypothetical protein